jgi:amino acid adenylation domain-containing protein
MRWLRGPKQPDRKLEMGEGVGEMSGETQMPGSLPDWNDTVTDYPRNSAIHLLFEQQVALKPHSIAIEFEDQSLCYQELNQRANRVAHLLRRRGVDRGSLVGLCVERSPELIIGMLGILKAGGAYVPLDPDYPDKRLSYMLRDTGTPVIVAHRLTASRLAPSLRQAAVLWIDSDDNAAGDDGPTNIELGSTADDLAYVMYTSGSTGTPKGVMVGHRAVVRLVRDTNYCQFSSDQVFLQLAHSSFDASTFEIWGALLNGARIAIMPPRSAGLDELGAAIRRHKVTTLWLTSGLFNLMVERRVEDLSPLRQLLAGGDVLSAPHVQKALETLHDGVIINGYGPTESTTFACCFRMTKDYRVGPTIPIGRPISNTTVHLLDEELRPVPVGSPGELCIGGDGLACGYLNHSELTSQKFITDPFSSGPGARLYRTGDLARERPDGEIEFLGRLDNQLKILGYRIEPGEIEAVLRQHSGVRQSAVVPAEGPRGDKRLVAYVVSAGRGEIVTEELKDYLARHLPPHMVPSLFVEIDALPLSPNGKVDRSALSAREQHEPADLSPAPLASELEKEISRIWQQVLSREVNATDNFFDLGGDSLQLIEVHSELQKTLGRELSIMDLFEFTTIQSLAERLETEPEAEPALAHALERAKKQKEAFACRKRSKVVF